MESSFDRLFYLLGSPLAPVMHDIPGRVATPFQW
jgi:hypothetical protein